MKMILNGSRKHEQLQSNTRKLRYKFRTRVEGIRSNYAFRGLCRIKGDKVIIAWGVFVISLFFIVGSSASMWRGTGSNEVEQSRIFWTGLICSLCSAQYIWG